MNGKRYFLMLALVMLSVLSMSWLSATWPSDSAFNVPICTAPGYQHSPTLVSDGLDGAIIVWNDYRDGYQNHYDVYAQRVLSDGSLPFVSLLSQSAQLETLPIGFVLFQNFPNPFNATTEIIFNVPEKSHIKIDVYNILGTLVRELTDGEYSPDRRPIFHQGR